MRRGRSPGNSGAANPDRARTGWRKLVKLDHPDRFAREPEKLETYHKLSSTINEARDAGDVAALREIAHDPDGFLLRLDFGDERRAAELHRPWRSLEMEIVGADRHDVVREHWAFCSRRLAGAARSMSVGIHVTRRSPSRDADNFSCAGIGRCADGWVGAWERRRSLG